MTTKAFFDMSSAEKQAFVARLEKGIPARNLKPLSSRDRALWDAAKRGRGRPLKAPGTKFVPVRVTFEPGLLAKVDAYTKAKGITRAELLARGALLAMTAGRSG